jgi:ABC-2 type transport system permease protein
VRGRFTALVGGELLKIRRQPANWPLPLVTLGAVALLAILSTGGDRQAGGADGVARAVLDPLTVGLQVGLGIPLLVIAARVTGQEYQLGTVRVLIARGTGRMRLLLAKLAALGVLAAAGVAATAALAAGALWLVEPRAIEAVLRAYPSLWRDAGLNLAATSLSLAACVLMGTFVAVLGRSVVFGMAFALIWFPIENLATLVLPALSVITGQDTYAQVTGYLLSANLDAMVQALEPWRRTSVYLPTPSVPVDGPHALLVVGAYLGAFLVAALLLTWRRDVHH